MFLPHTQRCKTWNKTERHKGTLGGAGYVFYLGSGHGFPGVFLCPNYSICACEIRAILCISSTHEQHCWEKTNKQKRIKELDTYPLNFLDWYLSISLVHVWMCSCSAVSNSLRPMDCSPSGSSVRRILQARRLEWVAVSYSRGSFWAMDGTHVSWISCIGRHVLYCCGTWEAIGM